MKEAAGEANMTVITIVLIGVVAAVGLLLIPKLMNNIKAKSCCTDAGWYVSGSLCCNPKDPDKCAAKGKLEDGSYKRLSLSALKNQKDFKACMGTE